MVEVSGKSALDATAREILGVSGSATGTTVTAGTINAKGSYTTIGTTTIAWNSFTISMTNTSTSERLLIDIAYGSGNTLVVDNFYFEGDAVNLGLGFYFPIFIPSGQAVKVRVQSTTASATCTIALTGFSHGGNSGAVICSSLSDYAASTISPSVTLTGNTPTAWTSLVASVPRFVNQFVCCPNRANVSTRTACDVLVEISSDNSTANVASFLVHQSTAVVSGQSMQYYRCPVSVAAGATLYFRCIASSNSAVEVFGVAANGWAS